jgi:hypothetical protein
MTPQVRMKTPLPPTSQNRIAALTAKSITRENFSNIFSAYHAALGCTNRMKSIAIILFALLLFTEAACSKVYVSVRQPASSSTLTGTHCALERELRNQDQKTDFWCWAASAHTVIEYLKQQPIEQCDIVSAALRKNLDAELENPPPLGSEDPVPNCCMATGKLEKPDPPLSTRKAINACWQNAWPEAVFETTEFKMNYKIFEYDWENPGPQGLGWDQIVAEICADRPMISTVQYDPGKGGGGHAVVIGGYNELDDGTQWVQVYDPGYSTLEGDFYLWPYEIYLGDPGVFVHVRDYTNISLP